MISREQLQILAKNKTFVSNVGRGGHVDTDALVEALQNGEIRGAAVDVTDPEPLPKGHPLWKAPNLFISPHVSWVSDHYLARISDILEINLRALAGEGEFVNKVNKELHY
jgi:phosphoglycerate dehydrogenase-like enzyme